MQQNIGTATNHNSYKYMEWRIDDIHVITSTKQPDKLIIVTIIYFFNFQRKGMTAKFLNKAKDLCVLMPRYQTQGGGGGRMLPPLNLPGYVYDINTIWQLK